MTQSDFETDPVKRFGLDIFQMVVDAQPVLIYCGRTERDADRYARFEGGRVVFGFRGDVLSGPDADMYVCAATDEQRAMWQVGFFAAVAEEKASYSDPSSFTCVPV